MKYLHCIPIRVIHLVRTQNFSKNEHFLPHDMHVRVRIGVRNVGFSENLAYVLNE